MMGCSEKTFLMALRALTESEMITNFLEFVSLRENLIHVKQGGWLVFHLYRLARWSEVGRCFENLEF